MILSSIVCRIRPKNVPGPAKRRDTAGVRLHSHRKNASAAKPQEAVQADRHSSKRKSLIFSSLPQKQAFACRQTQRHSRKNPISSLFGLCPLYHILAIKQACGLAAENPPPQTLQALKPYFSLYSVMVWYLSWVRVIYGHIDIPSSCSNLSTWEIRSADLATMEAAPR